MIKIKAVDFLQEEEKELSLVAEEPSDETSADEIEPAKDKKNLVTRQRQGHGLRIRGQRLVCSFRCFGETAGKKQREV